MARWEARDATGNALTALLDVREHPYPRIGELLIPHGGAPSHSVLAVHHYPADHLIVVRVSPTPPSTNGYGEAVEVE